MRLPILALTLALSACRAPHLAVPLVAHPSTGVRISHQLARRAPKPRVDDDPVPARAKPEIVPAYTGLSFSLDAAADPPTPVCTFRGTGSPFTDRCTERTIHLFADEKGTLPVADVDAKHVDVRFQLAPGDTNAWISIDQGRARIAGFTPLKDNTFRLRRDAVAFGGHVRLKADAPVSILQVGLKELSVATTGDSVNIEDVVASAPCDSLSYDPFEENTSSIESPDEGGPATIGDTLHLASSPGSTPILTLRADGPLYLPLRIVDRVRDERRVVFSTVRARFDVWVPASEIAESEGVGRGFGIGGIGCGGSSDGYFSPSIHVPRDVDVLVAKHPSAHGPRGIKLTRGARITASGADPVWAQISIADAPVSPPLGQAFWVTWRSICTPPSTKPPPDGERVVPCAD